MCLLIVHSIGIVSSRIKRAVVFDSSTCSTFSADCAHYPKLSFQVWNNSRGPGDWKWTPVFGVSISQRTAHKNDIHTNTSEMDHLEEGGIWWWIPVSISSSQHAWKSGRKFSLPVPKTIRPTKIPPTNLKSWGGNSWITLQLPKPLLPLSSILRRTNNNLSVDLCSSYHTSSRGRSKLDILARKRVIVAITVGVEPARVPRCFLNICPSHNI